MAQPLATERRVEQILDRWQAAKNRRKNFDAICDDIAEVAYPGRIGFNRELTEGERRTNRIVNGAAARASSRLGAILQGNITPRTSNWVDIHVVDEDIDQLKAVREWFDRVNKLVRAVIYAPNNGWETANKAAYREFGTFGGGPFFTGIRPDNTSLLFMNMPIMDVWIEQNAFAEVDTFFVLRDQFIYQAIQQFGSAEFLSAPTQRKVRDNKLTDKVKLLHFVSPRDDRDPLKKDRFNKPWASHWIEVDEKHEIQHGGFDYKPYLYPRFETVPGEVYPWSPGRLALPDALMLQAQARTTITAAQFQARPPLMVPDDGLFDVDQYAPEEIIYYDAGLLAEARTGNLPIQPLNVGANTGIGLDMMQETKQDIWQAFMLDLVNLPETANMTATEILRRNEDFVRAVGPSFAQLADEFPAQVVESTFQRLLEISIMKGFGDGSPFPEPPEVIQGLETKVNIKAPIHELQEKVEISSSLEQLTQAVAPLIKLDPSTRHHIDAHKAMREAIRVFAPAKFLASEEDAAAASQAEAEAAQREQGLVEGQQEADILSKVMGADAQAMAAEGAGV